MNELQPLTLLPRHALQTNNSSGRHCHWQPLGRPALAASGSSKYQGGTNLHHGHTDHLQSKGRRNRATAHHHNIDHSRRSQTTNSIGPSTLHDRSLKVPRVCMQKVSMQAARLVKQVASRCCTRSEQEEGQVALPHKLVQTCEFMLPVAVTCNARTVTCASKR